MLARALTWGYDFMAEIGDKVQHSRSGGDARQLWLPATAIVVLLGGAATAGGWIVTVQMKLGMVETQTTQLAEINGSLATLVNMQDTVSKTAAEVSSLRNLIQAQNTAIQTQNAWIATTRERLKDQGFETPPFNPPAIE